MRLTAIVVDDELLARKLIVNLLDAIPEIAIVGQYGTGKEAIKAIDTLRPDILFLDIQLKDMSGFEVLEGTQSPAPLVIFATAFDTYAIEAFNIFAFDYLMKPIVEERFYKSVNRAITTFKSERAQEEKENLSALLTHMRDGEASKTESRQARIPIPYGKKTLFVQKSDIIYILASNYYIEIYTRKAKYLLRSSMYTTMKGLDPDRFVRIHRSSIIHIDQVEELLYSAHNEIDVRMCDGKHLRVSRSYRQQFLIKMGIKK